MLNRAAGFEQPILEGGAALFRDHNVWFILAGGRRAWGRTLASSRRGVAAACVRRALLMDVPPAPPPPTECNRDILEAEGQQKFLRWGVGAGNLLEPVIGPSLL